MYPCATAYLSSCHPRSRSQVEPGDFCVRRGIFSRLGVKDGQKCPFKDSNVAALMRTTPWRVFGNHSSLTLLAKILLPLIFLPLRVGWDTALFTGKYPVCTSPPRTWDNPLKNQHFQLHDGILTRLPDCILYTVVSRIDPIGFP